MLCDAGKVDVLIDPLPLWQHMWRLAAILGSSSIQKILHGGGGDVKWLRRDFGLTVRNVLDTERLAKVCLLLSLVEVYLSAVLLVESTCSNIGSAFARVSFRYLCPWSTLHIRVLE